MKALAFRQFRSIAFAKSSTRVRAIVYFGVELPAIDVSVAVVRVDGNRLRIVRNCGCYVSFGSVRIATIHENSLLVRKRGLERKSPGIVRNRIVLIAAKSVTDSAPYDCGDIGWIRSDRPVEKTDGLCVFSDTNVSFPQRHERFDVVAAAGLIVAYEVTPSGSRCDPGSQLLEEP